MESYIIPGLKEADLKAVSYKAKMKALLRKLKNSYSEKVGIPVGSLSFLYDGLCINDEDTPGKLGMEDGDVIEVYVEQTGGLKRFKLLNFRK